MLPAEDRPIVYHIQFANNDYETDNYSMNILDMIAVFDGLSVDFALAAVDALLPGLVNTVNPLSEHLVLKEPGFTLSRDHLHGRDLRLHGLFGTFSFVNVPDWKPFSGYDGKPGLEGFLSTIQIPTPSLRLSVQDFFSETGARVSLPSTRGDIVLANIRVSSSFGCLTRSNWELRSSSTRLRVGLHPHVHDYTNSLSVSWTM